MRNCFFAVIIFLLSACAKPHSTVTSIHKFSEVPAGLLSSDTLILIDIDNTILRAAQHYGSVEHFEHMLKEDLSKGDLTKAQIKTKLLIKWAMMQDIINTRLIDEKIHNFIEQATAAKATILAFTAREPAIAYLSYRQLAKHNIYMSQLPEFSFSVTYKNKVFPDDNWCKYNVEICSNPNLEKKYHHSPAMFFKGIIFAYDLNHKGTVFNDFFARYKSYAINSNLAIPTKIIFIDDKMYNIASMQEASSRLGLEFYGYHIVDDFIFDSEKAKQEGLLSHSSPKN